MDKKTHLLLYPFQTYMNSELSSFLNSNFFFFAIGFVPVLLLVVGGDQDTHEIGKESSLFRNHWLTFVRQ